MAVVIKIVLQNDSEKSFDFFINETRFFLQGKEKLEVDYPLQDNMVGIRLENNIKSFFYEEKGNRSCSVFTDLKANCSFTGQNVTIHIGNRTHDFQNYTHYEYFTICCDNAKIYNLNYYVTNESEMLSVALSEKQKEKFRNICTMLLGTAIDHVLDFGLLCLIVWWIFDFKIAMIVAALSYIFLLIINIFCRKLDKSKFRFFNWAKSPDLSDDVDYLIKHINKFCH